ncbi:hypothetical protein F4781DRAFT_142747 [Annulohypoxylon bovei var. microspora]|nr:hypothetical protein F4781DRAFT_142747 [Annulohypoxylon bovei var. microspora]
MSLRQFTVAAVLAFATLSTATKEKAATDPIVGTDTVHGCYKSVGTMKHQNTDDFNSQGACAGVCRTNGYVAGASNSVDCWCGDEYPNKADLVDDDQCTEPCPGFGDDACGGLDTYTVYNTGKRVSVGEASEAGSSSSSSTSSKTSSASSPASTSDTIETITASSEPDSNKSTPNVAGIAGGVVVGVVAVGALIGGGFFWMRRKRNAEIEEEHRRNAAVNAFISGGKPPSSSGGLSMSDSRLDPVMNRRMSDGSIADNQDYSRRILRVTNA